MKILIIMICLLTLNCVRRIENVTIRDYGKQQIGENVFIKKLYLSDGDRVYLLVDRNDKFISSTVNASITISSGKSSRNESYVVFQ